jgi:hypothetical protein
MNIFGNNVYGVPTKEYKLPKTNRVPDGKRNKKCPKCGHRMKKCNCQNR